MSFVHRISCIKYFSTFEIIKKNNNNNNDSNKKKNKIKQEISVIFDLSIYTFHELSKFIAEYKVLFR